MVAFVVGFFTAIILLVAVAGIGLILLARHTGLLPPSNGWGWW